MLNETKREKLFTSGRFWDVQHLGVAKCGPKQPAPPPNSDSRWEEAVMQVSEEDLQLLVGCDFKSLQGAD